MQGIYSVCVSVADTQLHGPQWERLQTLSPRTCRRLPSRPITCTPSPVCSCRSGSRLMAAQLCPCQRTRPASSPGLKPLITLARSLLPPGGIARVRRCFDQPCREGSRARVSPANTPSWANGPRAGTAASSKDSPRAARTAGSRPSKSAPSQLTPSRVSASRNQVSAAMAGAGGAARPWCLA